MCRKPQNSGEVIVTLFFSLLGFLSPAHRGILLQSVNLIFTFLGAVAGSVAAKVSKIWNSGRIPVEIGNHLDDSLVSRDHIQRFLHAQPPHSKTFRLVQCLSRPCPLCSTGNLGFLCLLGSSEHTLLSKENGGAPSTNNIPRHIPDNSW